MFGALKPQSNLSSRSPITVLEPHISYFDIHTRKKGSLVFPFRSMGYILKALILLGLYFALVEDNLFAVAFITWLMGIPLILYLPATFYYIRFQDWDFSTEIEVDQKHGLIQYRNAAKGENLLFHVSQIDSCKVTLSSILFYRMDCLSLRLKGGKTINITCFIATPEEMLCCLKVPYAVERAGLGFTLKHR